MKTNEEMARQLHEWYLEATDQDGSRYNPEAVVPYDDLPEGSKIIDRYIAEKVLSLLASERADWLRSEIEKLEDELDRIKKYQIMVGEHKYYCECKAGNDYLDKFLQVLRDDSEPLSSIITRYTEELKVLESK